MAESYRCFLLSPTDLHRRSLRRFVWSSQEKCPGPMGYHDADAPLDVFQSPDGVVNGDTWPHDDPRWPKTCSCGRPFTGNDEWMLRSERLYARADTGETMALHDAPVGAMWWATWNTVQVGPDGRCLIVRLPGGRDWTVDSEASNCTRKGDRSHWCWVRHGEPPNVTVGKTGYPTCNAGAGSIVVPGWHGFLRNGVLVPC